MPTGACCDVCITQGNSDAVYENFCPELKVLIDALDEVGRKGEVKGAEWTRGSKLSWT